jgi:hypothetical protein
VIHIRTNLTMDWIFWIRNRIEKFVSEREWIEVSLIFKVKSKYLEAVENDKHFKEEEFLFENLNKSIDILKCFGIEGGFKREFQDFSVI